MHTAAFPEALPRLLAAIDDGILRADTWGDGTEAVCMMSAFVSGARGVQDCVTAGWPAWLVKLNVQLFDATVGADDEAAARQRFALDVAEAVQVPRDFDKTHDWFMVLRLADGEHSALSTLRSLDCDTSQQDAAVADVADLYRRRFGGQEVSAQAWVAAIDAAIAGAIAGARQDLIAALRAA